MIELGGMFGFEDRRMTVIFNFEFGESDVNEVGYFRHDGGYF